MTDGGGYTLVAAVVEGYHAAVAQRQLNFALTLLTGYLTRYGAVYLVGQPVLAGYGFQLQHVGEVFLHLGRFVAYVVVLAADALVHHHRLG